MSLFAQNVIQALEDVQRRPGLYLGPFMSSPEHVISFLSGLMLGTHAAGCMFGHTDDVYRAVVKERGWEDGTTRGHWMIMRMRGLDEHAIVRELLSIEIEAWKRRLDSIE